MALSDAKQKKLEVLVAKGDLSDRAIAKEVGCDPKTVRNYINKLDLEKSSLSSLAKEEITNTIMAKKIEEKKSSLNPHQRKAYEEVLVDMSIAMNMFNNSTLKNQSLLNMAQEGIEKAVTSKDGEVDKEFLVTQLPNILAISKGTEANRKQLFGATETYKPKEVSDNDIVDTIVILEDRRDG